jgi:hypothetical protein
MRQLGNHEGVEGMKTIAQFLAGSLLIVLSVRGLSSFHKNLLRLTDGSRENDRLRAEGNTGRTKS